ncbi:unnamed protein product, partial [Laminaria digitata]
GEEKVGFVPASSLMSSFVEIPTTCHCCGNTTGARKPSARCAACACVFHLRCMDPPCVSKRDLPRSGYTCRACREQKKRPELSETEASPQRGGWAPAGGNIGVGGGGGGFVVLGEA